MSVRNVIYFHEAGGDEPPFGALACKAETAFLSDRLASFLADMRVTRGVRVAPAPPEDGVTRVNGMAELAAKVVGHLVQAERDVASVALVDPAAKGQDDTADYRYRISPEREPAGCDDEARLMLSVENLDNGGAWIGLAEDYP